MQHRVRADQRKNLALVRKAITKEAEQAEVERVANALQGLWALSEFCKYLYGALGGFCTLYRCWFWVSRCSILRKGPLNPKATKATNATRSEDQDTCHGNYPKVTGTDISETLRLKGKGFGFDRSDCEGL